MRSCFGFTTSTLAALVLCAGCTPSREELATRHEATIDRFCTDCHNDVEREGGLVLEGVHLAAVDEHGEQLEKVLRKLEARMMPPPGEPRPDERTYAAVVEFLESELDAAAAARPRAARADALDDPALAARLARFLWSAAPDEALAALAEERRLREPETYRAQVRRMLDDARSSALVDGFATQWLGLHELQRAAPDPAAFPGVDADLRRAMRRETELLFETVMREDRNVLELLTADYTFLNQRLAEHYGIAGVYGSHFRRYRHRDPNRHGLLGHASILTLTSYPSRTSPALRGDWVLETILGTPVPGDPEGVPALDESAPGGASRTVRERLEQHRADTGCARCHAILDPIGFALEGFDAVGRSRTAGPGGEIDARATLVDGTPVDGPVALREALTQDPEHFVRVVVENLMAYALGRALEHYEMPAVRRIARAAAAGDYRFSVLVEGVVTSDAFRAGAAPADATSAVTAEDVP